MIRFNMFDSSCRASVARLSKMYHSILSGGSNWEQLESMITSIISTYFHCRSTIN